MKNFQILEIIGKFKKINFWKSVIFFKNIGNFQKNDFWKSGKKILKNTVFLKIPYITDCLSSCAAFLQAPKWSGWWCIRAVGSIMVLSYHTINSTYTSGAVFVWNIFKYFCPKTTNKFYFSWSLSCLKTFLKKHCSMISIMSSK